MISITAFFDSNVLDILQNDINMETKKTPNNGDGDRRVQYETVWS